MNRRSILKAIGSIGAAGAAGGGALLALSGSATATASQDFGSASLTSDDGTVDHVAIFGDSRVEWEGFESSAESFTIDIAIDGDRLSSPVQIHSAGPYDLTASSWGGDGERFSGAGTSGWIESDIGYDNGGGGRNPEKYWIIVAPGGDPTNANHPASGYGLPPSAVGASTYEVDQDGNTVTFGLDVESTYTWYPTTDGSGSPIFQKTFTSNITLTVNNVAASAEGGAPEDQQDNEEGVVAG